VYSDSRQPPVPNDRSGARGEAAWLGVGATLREIGNRRREVRDHRFGALDSGRTVERGSPTMCGAEAVSSIVMGG
jgi:hypothetical protein